ncbi:rho GTPase-activating protein 44-like [Artemia franciscana]|uniref:Uncharacterized protein n=1 Tax=Artemia franciscana TaxID=6661 RepID=A0AA88HPJ7_ARTSF|nr:hypothetical protein QYM36_013186 [Artemia franciscana]KAK2709442.1 hypothetical protein QYM36_013186 [Artemia franciscana]
MADKMKKQFFFVKGLANQSLFRTEKTEVLDESLLLAERRIDALQKACSVSARKILSCLAGHGTDATTVEKRSKKIPEILLANSMLEASTPFGDSSVLGRILHEVGSIENELGYELLQYELKVEQIVTSHLQQVESEVAAILKNRRILNKLSLEMDASRKVYQSNRMSSGNTKSDQLREDMEDSYQKVEISKDSLATEIYTLLAREPEFASTILKYAQLKRDYHRAAWNLLERNIPKLEQVISDNPARPVFGTKLETHLESSGRTIAFPIEVCICALLEVGLEEEGLFRVAGGSSKIRKLKAVFDAGYCDLTAVIEDARDPHVIASVLKSYLRELPEPLLTHELYEEWIHSVRASNLDGQLQSMKNVLKKMPKPYFINLRYLVRFFSELTNYQDVNKMTPSNIAIVIAPNLIWIPDEDGKNALGLNMSLANTYSCILEHLINHCEYFFPGSESMDFYITCSKVVLEQASPKSIQSSSRVSAPEFTQEAPTIKFHKRVGSFDAAVALANGIESPSSPKLPVRRKNKQAPVPPTPPKLEEPIPTQSDQKIEVEKVRPPLPPPPSERTATLPRLKEQKMKERNQSKEDLLAEIDKEVHRKLDLEEKRNIESGEVVEKQEKSNIGLSRAASIRNRAALFEKPLVDDASRMSKSTGTLTGDVPETSVVQRRLTFLEGQQVQSVKMPVPAERIRPLGTAPAESSIQRSNEKFATVVEVEKSKPLIPERPTALPRLERKNSSSNEVGKAVLEKAHVYSVDKHQPSFVQVPPQQDGLTRKNSVNNFNIESKQEDKAGKQIQPVDPGIQTEIVHMPSNITKIQNSNDLKTNSVNDKENSGDKIDFIESGGFAGDIEKYASDEPAMQEFTGRKQDETTDRESSDSDAEGRKKPAKPPKPERITKSVVRNSAELGDTVTQQILENTEGAPVAVNDNGRPPTALPRPSTQIFPATKSRSDSNAESTDF